MNNFKRADVIKSLKENFKYKPMRDFIRTNIDIDDKGNAYWKCNFRAIFNNIDNIMSGFE